MTEEEIKEKVVERYAEKSGIPVKEVLEHYEIYSRTFVFMATEISVRFKLILEEIYKSLMFWRKW